MKVGYIRVSTAEQNTIRQEVLMDQLGVEKVYIDKASGKDTDRPELNTMMSWVRDGDTVIVESISRFARNTKDLLNLIEALKEKNVQFVSQKENIDTGTPTGEFMLTVFGAIAQLERETTRQRQAEGIAAAKAEGKYKGRKPIAVDDEVFTDLYRQWSNGDITQQYMMKRLGMSRNTLYRRIRNYEERHGIRK